MKKTTYIIGLTLFSLGTQAQELSGLISKYSFNTANADDEIGVNDLTIVGGCSYGIDRFGHISQSVSLDGTSGHLKTTTPFFYPGNPFTISMWFKSANPSQPTQTFFNTDPHGQISVGYNWFGNGSYDIALNDGTGWNICSNAANGLDTFFVNTVVPTDWNHFTMTYDGTTWNSYLNTALVNTCNTGVPTSTISNLLFGAISAGPQSFFYGNMDDIRIFDRAITTLEVTELFNEIDPEFAGIESLPNSLVKLSPNPTSGNLIINTSTPTKIFIINVIGEELMSFEVNASKTIDISAFNSGIYLAITNEGESIKFIKE